MWHQRVLLWQALMTCQCWLICNCYWKNWSAQGKISKGHSDNHKSHKAYNGIVAGTCAEKPATDCLHYGSALWSHNVRLWTTCKLRSNFCHPVACNQGLYCEITIIQLVRKFHFVMTYEMAQGLRTTQVMETEVWFGCLNVSKLCTSGSLKTATGELLEHSSHDVCD
jgi:hypothetical protein